MAFVEGVGSPWVGVVLVEGVCFVQLGVVSVQVPEVKGQTNLEIM